MHKIGHRMRARSAEAGYTFVELLVVSTIIIILASAVMPLAKVTATRQREVRSAAGAARDADGDRQVQGRRRPRPDFAARAEGGRRRLSAGPADARRRRGGGQRRHRPQAEVSAPRSRRSDDARAPSGGCAPIRTTPTRHGGADRTSSTSSRRSRARRSTARSTGTGEESGNRESDRVLVEIAGSTDATQSDAIQLPIPSCPYRSHRASRSSS